MGEIAARLADLVIVTSDNPRSEDPERIIAEIMAGVPIAAAGGGGAPASVSTEVDRRAAIERGAGGGRAGRRRDHRRQGPRAGTGARRRAQAPLRRRHRRQGGPALARPPAGGGSARDEELGRRARGPRRRGQAAESALGAGAPGTVQGRDRFAQHRGGRAVRGPAGHPLRRRCARAGGARRQAPGGCSWRPATPAPPRPRAPTARSSSTPTRSRGCRPWPAPGASSSGAAGRRVVAITGSTGKTSTKDILAALLAASARTAASPSNHNTEIGLPLAILATAEEVDVLVLEMAMRGPGQIAQLTEIARPEVGVIVNVGAAHLELLGSLEAIAAAKAELIAGMQPGRHRRGAVRGAAARRRTCGPICEIVSFGEDGADVTLGRAPSRRLGRDRRPRSGAGAEAVVRAGAQPAQPAGRGRGRAGARLHARRGGARRVLRDARPAPAARGRRAADRGLLQRQPDVDARGARGSRGERPRPPRRRARRHARAGSAGTRAAPRGRPSGAAGPASSCWWRSGRWRGRSPRRSAARPARWRTPTPPRACCRACCAAGDTVLVKGSRGVGLEIVCSALLADAAEGTRAGAGHPTGASLQAHGAASGPR